MTTAWLTALIREHLRSGRALTWAGVLLAASLAMAFVPLLNVLGYGFALLIGFLGALAGADLGAAMIRRARDRERDGLQRADQPGRVVARLWLAAAAAHLALLVPPLAVISLNALRVKNCDWAFGFESFVLISCLSTLAGSTVGVTAGLLAGPNRVWSNLLPYLFLIGSAAAAVIRFYGEPPIFVYNAYIGYWPGTPYDESVTFGAPFYWSRLFQAAVGLGALSLLALALDVPSLRIKLARNLRPDATRLRPIAGAIIGLSVATSMWLDAGKLGFAVDAEDIQEALGGRHETDNFIIYYPLAAPFAREIETIAADHEFRLTQVSALLDARPSGKIVSYYFADADSKARWTGARRVHVAKPWRREIYLDHQPFPHGVVRHELAHVVAGEFGDPVFHVSVGSWFGLPLAFNPGLIEGLAVAVDWPDRRGGNLTPHQSVKVMVELGMAPPIEQVMSPRFLAFASSRSYTVAGSFMRYVLERFGVDRLRALYRTGGDFMAALGRSRAEVIADWRAMIDQIELPPGATEIVREAFRRPGILERDCPIAIARRHQRVSELYARGRIDEAVEQMRRVCRDDPSEPRYQLTLASLLDRAGDRDEAERIRSLIAADAERISASLRTSAMLDMVRPAFHRGDFDRVRELLLEAGSLQLPDDEARAVVAQQLAMDHQGPAAGAFRRYFWGDHVDELPDGVVYLARAAEMVAAEPELAIGHYLFGRNLVDRGVPGEAAAALHRSLQLGLPHPLLVREAAQLLARTAYLAGDDPLVREAVAILTGPDQPRTVRLRAEDWLERLRWRDQSRSAASSSDR